MLSVPNEVSVRKADVAMKDAAFPWRPDSPSQPDEYLLRPVLHYLRAIGAKRVMDLGCGNGRMTGALAANGYLMTGCDVNSDAIEMARVRYPQCSFHCVNVSDAPPERNFD